MTYKYVDIDKNTIKQLYDIAQTNNIQGFVAEKIRALDKKIQKDNRIMLEELDDEYLLKKLSKEFLSSLRESLE